MLRCRGPFQGANALLFDESPTFSAPAAFGTYRVLHQAGSGVLGPVFRTSDPRRPDLIAVKAFALDLLPEDVVRLADALRRLAAEPPSHPAIAAILDAGLEATSPFLATEYLIGDTLDVVLRRRAPVGVAEALRLLTPVAGALDAAWACGAGHGALHPRDVFVGSEAHGVKVTGVGVSRALEAAGLTAPARRPYTAPERTSGAWDQRADVYSIAVLAHELLTGRRPAGASEQDGVFAADVTPEQRVALRRALSVGLAERAEDRPATASAFIDTLAAADAGAAVPVRPPAPVEPVAQELFELTAASDLPVRSGDARPIDLRPAANDLPLTALADFDPEPSIGPRTIEFDAPEPVRSEEAPAAAAETAAPHPAERLPMAPLADLSYRSPTSHEPPGDSAEVSRSVLWQAGEQPRPRAARFAAIVLVCLAAGAAAGYLAGAYDPFAPAGVEERAAEEPSVARAAPAEADAAPVAPPSAPADTVAAATPPADATAPSAERLAPTPSPPSRQTRPRRPAAPPPGAALAIRSQPSGAMVTIDGRIMGETPLVLRDLAAGPYLLQIARPGYAPHQERVTLPTAGERTLSVALEEGVTAPGPGLVPAARPGLGAIQVESAPRGARVLVDGRFVGQTPLRLPEVASGSHTVTLELAGVSSVTRRALVEPGQTAKVSVSLR